MVNDSGPAQIDSAAAAQILGVVPSRIRQLVSAGKLTPIDPGSRPHSFRRSDVERLAGRTSTTDARDLSPAPAPLTRLQDVVMLDVPLWASETVGAHVRVFQGAAAEGTRTVIIVGRMTGGFSGGYSLPDTGWAAITDRITARYLPRPEDALNASWILFEPTDSRELRVQTEYEALLFDTTPNPDPDAGSRGLPWWPKRRTAGDGGAPAAPQLKDPRYLPLSVREVEALIGQPLEYYPVEAYWPQVIEDYLKTGKPVVYTYDGARGTHVGDLFDNLTVLTRGGGQQVPEDLQERAAAHIADEIRMRSKYLDDLAWDDGSGHADEQVRPSVMAARLERYRLSRTQWKLIDGLAGSVPEWPWSDEVAMQAVRDMVTLQDLASSVDQFSASPDAALEDAAGETAGLIRHYVMAHDYRASGHPAAESLDERYPRKRHHASVFRVGSPANWDSRYLDSVSWDDEYRDARRPGLTLRSTSERDRNELAAALPSGARVRFGVDFEGNPVARVDSDGPDGDTFAVLWPLLFGDVYLPAGARLVADRGEYGARPVYLVDADGMAIRPLPITTPGNGWQFGYPGGGPGYLESSVIALVRRADGTDPALIPRAVLEAAISHTEADAALDFGLDRIRPALRGLRAVTPR
ncbi:helix-turn-helix domain-containing protein [Tsukamurella hominis]|uniref:helix-turn-helix domain-containing protein n=1 Tax=Tsukamurella hominis TaxID=1970232 RepID=UPI0039EBD1BC